MNPILQPLDTTPRIGRRRALGAPRLKFPPPTDGTPCAARQTLGTRICDQAHGHHGPHVGEGPNDPRNTFWGP